MRGLVWHRRFIDTNKAILFSHNEAAIGQLTQYIWEKSYETEHQITELSLYIVISADDYML